MVYKRLKNSSQFTFVIPKSLKILTHKLKVNTMVKVAIKIEKFWSVHFGCVLVANGDVFHSIVASGGICIASSPTVAYCIASSPTVVYCVSSTTAQQIASVVKIKSLLRQNDVATSFRCTNDVIITSCVCCRGMYGEPFISPSSGLTR